MKQFRIRIAHTEDPKYTKYHVESKTTIFGISFGWWQVTVGACEYSFDVVYDNIDEAKAWIDREYGMQHIRDTYIDYP